MKYKEIGLGLTINMGNYESVRFDLVAELEDWEDLEESMKALRKRLVEITKIEVNNGESTVIRKLDIENKYIKEIEEKSKKVEELRRQRNKLIDQLQSLEFDISGASELLKAFRDLSYYNSVIKDLRNVVDTYSSLTNRTKQEDDTGSVSLSDVF